MARLRAPGGCPWDREQTFDSIKPYTVEETYEVLDAIDRRDWKDLAEELGMSKKTLYRHFPSKRSLIEAAILNKFESIELDMERAEESGSADFQHTLENLVACMRRHIGEVQPPFIRDIKREAPEMFNMVEERRKAMIQRHFGKLFERGRSEGMIREDVPQKLVIDILLGAVEAIMNPRRIEEYNLAPQQTCAAILSVILDGALTAKGRTKP